MKVTARILFNGLSLLGLTSLGLGACGSSGGKRWNHRDGRQRNQLRWDGGHRRVQLRWNRGHRRLQLWWNRGHRGLAGHRRGGGRNEQRWLWLDHHHLSL